MTKPFVDYSQFSTFSDCEYKYVERYLNQTVKAPRGGQRSDAQTLGSLAHAMLQNWRTLGTHTLTPEQVGQYDPTPECLMDANMLVLGYLQAYPQEAFTKYYCEEPLKFDLLPEMDGLAKIDSYFNTAEQLTIQSGLGDTLSLEPGWWVHEYKTKSATKDVGKYLGSWRMNMQAVFQMLALQQLTGETPKGVLVNVLEKPLDYKPKRSCKGCKNSIELRDWQPTGEGYRCPQCGNVQDLDTSDKSKAPRTPKFYRIMVQRNMAELERGRADIEIVAKRMLDLMVGGVPLRRTNSCVDQIWGDCEYFTAHSALMTAREYGSGFVAKEALEYVTR